MPGDKNVHAIVGGYYLREVEDGFEFCFINVGESTADLETCRRVVRHGKQYESKMLVVHEDKKEFSGIVGDVGLTLRAHEGTMLAALATTIGVVLRDHGSSRESAFSDREFRRTTQDEIEAITAAMRANVAETNEAIERPEREKRERERIEREYVRNKYRILNQISSLMRKIEGLRKDAEWNRKCLQQGQVEALKLRSQIDESFFCKVVAEASYVEQPVRWWWRFSRKTRGTAARAKWTHKRLCAAPAEVIELYKRCITSNDRLAEAIAAAASAEKEPHGVIEVLEAELAALSKPEGLEESDEAQIAKEAGCYSYW